MFCNKVPSFPSTCMLRDLNVIPFFEKNQHFSVVVHVTFILNCTYYFAAVAEWLVFSYFAGVV